MVASASDAGVILRSAINAGVMGATSGYLWVLSDAITSNLDLVQEEAGQSATTAGDLLMVQGVDDIHPYMKGSIGCLPISPVGSKVEAFKERYTSRQSTLPSGTCENDASVNGDCTCAAGVDDAGAPLFQFDHDSSDGTPDRCVGFDYAQDEPNEYTYYAYDAVYAFAHAAQKMIDDDQTDFNGPALQEALKQMGAFEGVTGAVEFENNGDRETGIKFDIVNHDGNEFLSVGSWTAGGTVVWADEAAGKDSIVWSTLDGSQVIDEVIDAGGLKDSMSAATILTMLVVGAIIVFLVVLFFKSQIARKDKEVAELKHDLAMVQQYSDKEQKMIQDMINTFRHEHADHKKAQQDPNKSYDAAAAEKDLERLLINSSEIECQDVVGSTRASEVACERWSVRAEERASGGARERRSARSEERASGGACERRSARAEERASEAHTKGKLAAASIKSSLVRAAASTKASSVRAAAALAPLAQRKTLTPAHQHAAF